MLFSSVHTHASRSSGKRRGTGVIRVGLWLSFMSSDEPSGKLGLGGEGCQACRWMSPRSRMEPVDEIYRVSSTFREVIDRADGGMGSDLKADQHRST